MEVVSTLVTLLASFNPVFTSRTADNLRVLLRGAVLAVGPHTVSGCMLAAWPWVEKHWSAYGNVLRRARMDMRALARILFALILRLIPTDAVIELAVDESLVRRWGSRVVGVGMHRDPVRSSHGRNAVTPGHKWVVLSVLVRLPYIGRALALPLASVLYTTKKQARRNRAKGPYRRHRTVSELTLILVRMVVRWAPERRFRLIGDGTYATHDLADAMNPHSKRKGLRRVALVSRFRMDAATYEAAGEYSGRGRPRIKGHRLPGPGQVAADPRTEWQRVVVAWYGATCKLLLLCSGDGLWYKCGNEAKWVRWVVVRDPEGKHRDEVFFTTDMTLTPTEVVEVFVCRWSLETTFQEARAHLGLESLRNRASRAVRRSVPLLLGVYSLIVVWFGCHVANPEQYKRQSPWYKKQSVTFSDMLAAARLDVLRELFSAQSGVKTRESLIQSLYAEPFGRPNGPIKRAA